MKRALLLGLALFLLAPLSASTVPVGGLYSSTDLGGQLLTVRVST